MINIQSVLYAMFQNRNTKNLVIRWYWISGVWYSAPQCSLKCLNFVIYFIRLTPKFPSCVRTVYRVMCLPAIRFTAGTDSGLLKCLNFVETFSVIWRPCFLRLCLNSEMAEKKKLKKTTPYPSRSRVWITSMTKSSLLKSSFRSTMTCKNLLRSGTQLLVDFWKKVFCN